MRFLEEDCSAAATGARVRELATSLQGPQESQLTVSYQISKQFYPLTFEDYFTHLKPKDRNIR
jgi:hypothetical protein